MKDIDVIKTNSAFAGKEVTRIPVIVGDGIGPEIWAGSRPILDKAIKKTYAHRRIDWIEVLAGKNAYEKTGKWLPEETLDAIRDDKVAIKGPLETPIGIGRRSLTVTMRQKFDLYACVRPVRYFEGVPSPLKEPEKTNMTIFRENTEDVYAGIEFAQGEEDTKKLIDYLQSFYDEDKFRFRDTTAIGIKPISKEGSLRLITAAIDYAIENNKESVTLVHKGNIMKFTEGGFEKWGYELAERKYGDKIFSMRTYRRLLKDGGREVADQALKTAQKEGLVIIKDIIADNFLQQILLHPENFDVIATTNLNGDYMSDALAAQVGGIGISPGANINYDTGYAMFEATHGTAPDIAGLGKANPCSFILSACMLLDYIGMPEASDLITTAIEEAFKEKKVTSDFASLMDDAQEVSTSEFCNIILEKT